MDLTAVGKWTWKEADLHISILEVGVVQDYLMAHSLALMSDNSTVVAYLNDQGVWHIFNFIF